MLLQNDTAHCRSHGASDLAACFALALSDSIRVNSMSFIGCVHQLFGLFSVASSLSLSFAFAVSSHAAALFISITSELHSVIIWIFSPSASLLSGAGASFSGFWGCAVSSSFKHSSASSTVFPSQIASNTLRSNFPLFEGTHFLSMKNTKSFLSIMHISISPLYRLRPDNEKKKRICPFCLDAMRDSINPLLISFRSSPCSTASIIQRTVHGCLYPICFNVSILSPVSFLLFLFSSFISISVLSIIFHSIVWW